MQQDHIAPGTPRAGKARTKVAAAILGVEDQTMRRGLCVSGHYCGLVPQKLPNRLLLWDLGEIDRLLAGEAIEAPAAADIAAHFARKAADAAKSPERIAGKVRAKAKRLSAARPAAAVEVLTTAGRDL